MEATEAPGVNSAGADRILRQLSDLFGSYKAEWLNERVMQLFTAPAYFSELTGNRPWVLIGGRGTGKTTVLRGLSYQGQFALLKENLDDFLANEFVGIYYRVDTNRVSALQGPEIENWGPIFGHYLNLLICSEIIDFIKWFGRNSGRTIELSQQRYDLLAAAFGIPSTSALDDLADQLFLCRVQFEAYINNVADDATPHLSPHGAPVRLLVDAVRELDGLTHKRFDILIDEYENLQNYQQQVINTLIKHSDSHLSYKIGVRELGWRVRSTLNENEQLISPSDYDRVDVNETLSGDTFRQFAADVCNSRLAQFPAAEAETWRIEELLPGLSEEEEAVKLGASEYVAGFRAALSRAGVETFDSMSLMRQLVLTEWARENSVSAEDALDSVSREAKAWRDRFGNYGHAYLFTIRRGKRGIRKYYCGWDVFTQLAGGNIRYLLEMVEESLTLHIRRGGVLGSPVPVELQTRAAANVAARHVAELEGLAVNGAKITKLVLSLGRIFQTMASDPAGHAPEVNHFRLSDGRNLMQDDEADRLLSQSVMHLALVRFPGNKLASTQTREYDYALHPLYAALFAYSHRRKRKMVIAAEDLLGLVADPPRFIRKVLAGTDRQLEEADVPEQLALFREFYR